MKIKIKTKELKKIAEFFLNIGYTHGVIDTSYGYNYAPPYRIICRCPDCNEIVDYNDTYCKHCGNEISWLE